MQSTEAVTKREHLKQALPEDRVLVGQQAARDVRVGDLQEAEPRRQRQADALLR